MAWWWSIWPKLVATKLDNKDYRVRLKNVLYIHKFCSWQSIVKLAKPTCDYFHIIYSVYKPFAYILVSFFMSYSRISWRLKAYGLLLPKPSLLFLPLLVCRGGGEGWLMQLVLILFLDIVFLKWITNLLSCCCKIWDTVCVYSMCTTARTLPTLSVILASLIILSHLVISVTERFCIVRKWQAVLCARTK